MFLANLREQHRLIKSLVLAYFILEIKQKQFVRVTGHFETILAVPLEPLRMFAPLEKACRNAEDLAQIMKAPETDGVVLGA